ncbi:MAG TPA: chromosome segregation protein SMC [Tetragenococcus sp.]|nr:chromosome segregation protein SMC [Tetragenococcus sp.]
MYLKTVELAGFKSFADRTKIDFEDRVTGIVGPNGSGKSNITEAVRWVLGEQSARNLRGGKMPDVIFAGSDSRSPLNIAEVTVNLDNSDGYLPVDFNEISVTRRLNRNGDSDFFINKKSCRLKDIQELFMDSGLGKESFSIISQGKVEAIFASKPQDRRGIFEEAAGVLKYKQRKKQAEQKLFETEDNLSRVQDILYELEDQLAPLKIQKETAQKYLTLKEEFSQIDVSYTVAEIKEAKITFDESRAELGQLATELNKINQSTKEKENKLQKQKMERGQLDNWLEKNNQAQFSLVEALKNAESQLEVLQERSRHSQKSASEYKNSLAEVSRKLQLLDDQKSQLIQQLSQKNGQVQTVEKDLQQIQVELKKYQQSTKELIEELRSKYVELMQEQADCSNELKYLEKQYLQETAKNHSSMEKQRKTSSEYKTKKTEHQQLTAALQKKQENLQQQRQQYVQLQAKNKEYQANYFSTQKKMYQLMDETRQLKARIKSLQDIQESYTGFYQGVRFVLQRKNNLQGILGAVAQLIEVPKEYTTAIETALGAQAQHVIVENEAAARKAITFLKQNRGGRATFLPLTTIKARQLSMAALKQAQSVEGFLGIASQLVVFPENLQAIVENLLGTTLIAEDLASANKISQTVSYRYRVVSLEGDVMNAGGSMTGGATKSGNKGSLLSQNNDLQELKKRADMSDQRLKNIEKQAAQFQAKANDCQEKLELLRQKGEDSRLEEQELQGQIKHLEEIIERLDKEQQAYQFENQAVEAFITEYQEQKAQLTEKQDKLSEQLQTVQSEIEQLDQQGDLMEKRRSQLSQSLAAKQAKLAVNKEQVHALKRQIAAVDEQNREQKTHEETVRHQLQAVTFNVSDHEMTESSLQQQIVDLQQKKDSLQTDLAENRTKRDQLYQMMNTLEAELAHLRQEQKDKMTQQTNWEVRKSQAENILDLRLAYLQEEYHLTYEKAEMDFKPVEKIPTTKTRINDLRQQMAALGPVNIHAIDQYNEVLQRYDFLNGQKTDLLQAKNQLFTTMDEMDEEVKSRFKDIFEQIREKFKMVFPNMFGGGKAELLLTDPQDLLNTGIEIEAQPPGKKLQNLSLLSGGERALTAIALLFSIIQVRPVPFCILDEVEAALDEANILRFANYLRSFKDDTQFIVVTHRKGTMEACQVLYGVTMEESGVSKIVSVRLEEVVENSQIKLK